MEEAQYRTTPQPFQVQLPQPDAGKEPGPLDEWGLVCSPESTEGQMTVEGQLDDLRGD